MSFFGYIRGLLKIIDVDKNNIYRISRTIQW